MSSFVFVDIFLSCCMQLFSFLLRKQKSFLFSYEFFSEMMEDITKTIMFTTNNLQGTPTIQYQTVQTGDLTLKQPKMEGQKQDFPTTFCYVANSNMIQKITPTTQVSNVSTVNLAQLTTEDNKTHTVQYIAQPLGYNYALVNPMQLQKWDGECHHRGRTPIDCQQTDHGQHNFEY